MKIEVFVFLIVLAESHAHILFIYFPPRFMNNSVDLSLFIFAARFGKF